MLWRFGCYVFAFAIAASGKTYSWSDPLAPLLLPFFLSSPLLSRIMLLDVFQFMPSSPAFPTLCFFTIHALPTGRCHDVQVSCATAALPHPSLPPSITRPHLLCRQSPAPVPSQGSHTRPRLLVLAFRATCTPLPDQGNV